MESDITIQCFSAADIAAVMALQLANARVYPGALVIPAEHYLSPAFSGGQAVFCAYQGGRLAAYAPVYLQPVTEGPDDLPQIAWAEIMAHPEAANAQAVKDRLFDQLTAYARAGQTGRPLRMMFEYSPGETAGIDYVQSRGFAYTESLFQMRRDLSGPLPQVAAPAGVGIRRWKMETVDEQAAYLAARNRCFPEAPTALEAWQYFMTSPLWAVGTTVAAFAGDRLVGNVNVYWNEDEIQREGTRLGYTEDIFVIPEWRGRGVARAMIADGLAYLQAHGLAEARLSVKALNANALGLYRSLGFEVIAERRFYAKMLA